MPTPSTAAPRPDLAVVAMEVVSDNGFIAEQALPVFPVAQATGTYPVITAEALLSMPNVRRAARSLYGRSDYKFELDTYDCIESGQEDAVDDKEAKMYTRYFDAEKVSTKRMVEVIKRAQEYRTASLLFNASNFTANAVTNEWDDGSNATPITDVKAGIKTIKGTIGIKPNTLIISYSTFEDLGVCDQIVDRVKYTNPNIERGDIAPALLAKAFGVQQVLVGGGIYNSAIKGQDASISAIWSNEYAMLCNVSNDINILAPSVGRTFLWTEDSPSNVVVESYRDEPARSNIIRARQNTDEELILTSAAYLLSNITT